MSTPWHLTHHPIGVPVIDADHDRLAALISSIQEQIVGGAPLDTVLRTLAALVGCVRAHFLAEEEHMIGQGYPHFADHRAEHTRLMIQIQDLVAGVSRGQEPLALLPEQLQDWLRVHCESQDRAYGRWLR